MSVNPFYVYALKDPRSKPMKIFYIGKGTGSRKIQHLRGSDKQNTEKNRIIDEIKKSGYKVFVDELVGNLTETEALKIEAELIAAFGIRPNGSLVNIIKPNVDIKKRDMNINIPLGCYENAQNGLELIKKAILELLIANKNGLSNADISKYLGLQSSHNGGQQDYLIYSILGNMMKEKKIKKETSNKYIVRE